MKKKKMKQEQLNEGEDFNKNPTTTINNSMAKLDERQKIVQLQPNALSATYRALEDNNHINNNNNSSSSSSSQNNLSHAQCPLNSSSDRPSTSSTTTTATANIHPSNDDSDEEKTHGCSTNLDTTDAAEPSSNNNESSRSNENNSSNIINTQTTQVTTTAIGPSPDEVGSVKLETSSFGWSDYYETWIVADTEDDPIIRIKTKLRKWFSNKPRYAITTIHSDELIASATTTFDADGRAKVVITPISAEDIDRPLTELIHAAVAHIARRDHDRELELRRLKAKGCFLRLCFWLPL